MVVMHPNLLMLESGNSMIEIILFNVLGLRIQGIQMIHCYFADLQNTGLVEPVPLLKFQKGSGIHLWVCVWKHVLSGILPEFTVHL